jgi:hypothetical protein
LLDLVADNPTEANYLFTDEGFLIDGPTDALLPEPPAASLIPE